MKFYSNTLLPELTKASIKSLATIVKETPDVFATVKKARKISAADLWMIHKQKRIFSTRRFI